MKQYLVLVTGAPGSGKTEFSQRVARLQDYEYVNAGQLLRRQLELSGTTIRSKEQIGPRFLTAFGLKGYLETVGKHAFPGVVIDGIRLASAIQSFRRTVANSVHIHRRSEGQLTLRTVDDPYSSQIPVLEKIADYKVAWQETLKELDDSIRELFADLAQ